MLSLETISPLLFRQAGLFSALLGLMLAAPTLAPAQQGTQAKKDQLSEKTSEELGKLRTLLEAKNWDAGLALVDAQLAKVDPSSYDAAMLLNQKGQILVQGKNDYTSALEPWERCLQIADANNYFGPVTRTEMCVFLAQLYFQQAISAKLPSVAAGLTLKAENYIRRWAENTKRPTEEGLMFYAQILYQRALAEKDKPNPELLKRGLEQVDAALHLKVRPRDELYLLKVGCLQLLGRDSEAAEYFELLVAKKPDNKNYWQQLANTYLKLANDTAEAKQEQDSYAYNVRAIVTYERGQAHQTLNTPKDYFLMVNILLLIKEYEKAIDLLESGLADGKIENAQKNWEFLAMAYQEIHREEKAIETLEKAAKLYPQAGQIEYFIALLYNTALENSEKALQHLQACIAKGGSDKPYVAYMYLAWVAFELKKYDVALDAATQATKYPGSTKEAEVMKKSIENVLKDREAKLNQAKLNRM